MNYGARLKNLAQMRGLSVLQLAEVFGVDYQTMHAWYVDKAKPSRDFVMTLERFERDQKPALSPRVPENTVRAFYGASL